MSSRYYSKRLKDKAKKDAKRRRPRSRPKSFKTEEAAKKYAESKKMKDYKLKKLSAQKIIIIK